MPTLFSTILTGLYVLMRYCAWRNGAYRSQLAERDFVAQIRVRDADIGRWFSFANGTVRSRAGIHAHADITISYETAAQAVKLLFSQFNWQKQLEAAKNFPPARRRSGRSLLPLHPGDDGDPTHRLAIRDRASRRRHALHRHDEWRALLRPRPERQDPAHHADRLFRRGCRSVDDRSARSAFTPPRKTTIAPHGLAWKSLVYSPDRLLYPMRRVDFDPNGDRRPENRAASRVMCASAGTRRSISSHRKSSG